MVYQITNDEGRVIQNASGGYGYEYDIKDHLGSLRVSFKDSVGIAKTTQESHTGVFGDVLPSLIYTNTPKVDNFDYTGHERLKTFNLGYIDAGARLYDPFVPRFTTIDPLSETSRRFSPFTYGNNNPIRFIDPDGMEAEDTKKDNNYVPTNFEYSDGYSTQSSRNSSGVVSFSGGYQNIGSSDGGGDKPKINSTNGSENYAGGTRLLGTTSNQLNIGEGEKEGVFKGALAIGLTTAAADGPIPIGDVIGGIIIAGATIYDASQRVYITYTLRNKTSGQIYVGRSSGFGDPYTIMQNRYSGHHMRYLGFGDPQLDRAVQGIYSYPAIRGREQQLIDFHGGVSATGNSIRGVGYYNPAARLYHAASNTYFGNIASYTGF